MEMAGTAPLICCKYEETFLIESGTVGSGTLSPSLPLVIVMLAARL